MEYRRLGLQPTCRGNERIRVSADGRVWHSRNSRDCEPGVLWSDPWRPIGQLGEAALESLRRRVVDTGLLDAPSVSVDESAEGGSREEIDLSLDGRDHHIVVQNRRVPAVQRAVALLWDVKHSLSA